MLVKMDTANAGGGGVENYYIKTILQTNKGDEVLVVPLFGLTKVDATNSISNSSMYIKAAMVTDWTTMTLSDKSSLLTTIENAGSVTNIDVSGYDVVLFGTNNRTNSPVALINIHN